MNINQRNTNVRFGMSVVLTFMMCMFVASWIATQYLAAALDYQQGLGEAAWSLGRRKIYQPFAWWFWNLQWMNEEGPLRAIITRTQFIALFGAVASVAIGIFMFYRRSMQSELPEDLHGSARWANLQDIERMRLISHSYSEGKGRNKTTVNYKAGGVYIGAYETPNGRKVLRYNEPAHLLCYAPSRSGKGVGPVLCTLLSYPHSTATNDIKGENFELSSGFRHTAGSLVIRFDPTSLDQKKYRWENALQRGFGLERAARNPVVLRFR
ncbi:type IV secretory system conjugative DNA transfer family protein [Undibacterium arcticum]